VADLCLPGKSVTGGPGGNATGENVGRPYDKLLEVLSPWGANNAFGEGDFWIVDDDYGGYFHKIVANSKFWSELVTGKIQKVLANSFSDWGVIVVLEDIVGVADLLGDGSGGPGAFTIFAYRISTEAPR
jgi:hypothetical protein